LSARRQERRTFIQKRREEWRSKAKKYHESFQQSQANLIKEKRLARNAGNFYVAPEAKVAFVLRLKGINKIRPQVKKILQLFRLRQINNGVFVKINKATVNMLKRVEPYITYGYPSRKTISDLIYKRGFVRVNRSRIPITDNAVIEQNLGQFGINCVEDLIEEIYQVGPHFKEANNFLWAFKLSNPRGGWRNKNHPFHKDGDWGNREEQINALVSQMN
jgi:large subunit ribosomal protein L7e